MWIQRSRRETLCPFSHHIPFHQGKSDPSRDFQARQDNLTCSKMTLLLSAPPRSLSLSPPISSWGAELAQMRDTLKNKLLIWDWVDSDGWPVLKGTAKRGWLGQLIISVDTRRWCSPSYGIFSIKRPLECGPISMVSLFHLNSQNLHLLVVKVRPASALVKNWSNWMNSLTGEELKNHFSQPEVSKNKNHKRIRFNKTASGNFSTTADGSWSDI